MARPRKDGVDYFPHFVNYGKTVPILKQRFGNDGYAAWFQLLEMLGKSVTHSLELDDPIEWEFAIATLGISEEMATEFFAMLAKLQAIDPDLWTEDKVVWCQKFVDNLEDLYRKRSVSAPEKPALRSNAGVSAPETPVIAPIMQQSTAQHSTVKHSISDANASSSVSTDAPADEDESIIQYSRWKTELIQTWNDHATAPPFARVSKISDDRDKHLRARFGEKIFREQYPDIIRIITESPFCRGSGPRGWIASFDWIIKNNGNYTKALEGKYGQLRQTNGQSNGRTAAPNPAEYAELAAELGIGDT
jgi:Lin1244/Lin1753-like, N-terminal